MITEKDRLRKRARRKFLGPLYAKQNSLCHWCKSQTVILANIPTEAIVSETAMCVTWKDGPFVFQSRIASIDHVNPIRDGGDNDPSNLVMACLYCNNKRTKTESPIPDTIRKMCSECGGEKPLRRSRCKDCYVKIGKEWLASLGWVEVPSNCPDQSKFRNPVNGDEHILTAALKIAERRKRIQ